MKTAAPEVWRARAAMTARGAMRLAGELWAVGAQVDTLVTEPLDPPTADGDRIVHLILRSDGSASRADIMQALRTVGRNRSISTTSRPRY